MAARPTNGMTGSSSMEDLIFEGHGCVWDETRLQFILVRGDLEVISKNCISFTWVDTDALQSTRNITYHRLHENSVAGSVNSV